MKQPLVSIITPTYNHEKYIKQCILSVQQQLNYMNWELIVVDDHSTDATVKIINEFMKLDKRIKLITHDTNWGILKLQASYNQALEACNGEIVAILEGDDYWPNDKLINQVLAFYNHKTAVLSYGRWEFVNNKGRHIYTRNYPFDKSRLDNIPTQSIFELFLTLRFDIASSTVLIKRKTLKEIGGFQSDIYYPFIDLPTYLALAKEGKFLFINKILGSYRRSQQSAWLNFAKGSKNMGREEMRLCINNFVVNKINKNLVNKELLNKQQRYLKLREYIKWLSIILNTFIQ